MIDKQVLKGIESTLLYRGEAAVLAEITSKLSWEHGELDALLLGLASIGYGRWPSVLVSMGSNINTVGDEGQTVLSQCVHGEKSNIFGAVDPTFMTAIECLSLGADPNALYMSEFPLISLTLTCNKPEFASLFIASGANLTLPIQEEFLTSEHQWARQLLSICLASQSSLRT
jgi:hypothetical protein